MQKSARDKEQALANPPPILSLADAAQRARSKEDWPSTGRAAEVLMKTAQRHVVFVVLRKGGEMARHRARGAVLIHVLSGRIRVGTDQGPLEAGPAHLITLDPLEPHDVEALEESEFLLFVVPDDPSATENA